MTGTRRSSLVVEERPDGVDGDGGRLILGEWLRPAGHGGHRDQRRAGEEENEHRQDGGHLSGLGILHGQPDRGADPAEGVAEGDDQGDADQARSDAVVEAGADREPDDREGDALEGGVETGRGREQDRRALSDEILNELPQVVPRPGVKARGGLVKEQHWRAPDEAGSQVKPPSHAAPSRS
jgi:hypothetical protein